MNRQFLTLLLITLVFAGAFPTARADEPSKPDLTLPRLETRVLGQAKWLRGGPAGLRVIVSDHQTGQPVRAEVTVSLARLENGKPGTSQRIYAGGTSSLGTVNAHFTAPTNQPGPYQLTVAVRSRLGEDSVSQPIQLAESAQILLTADKPLYQPGQTIHMRALALDMATRAAVTDAPITFEVEDARGNKVFKNQQTLSRFGLAGVDFILADEVNMGTFTLRAVLAQAQAEKKVRVERYVLPKFKVSLTPERTFYMPGETVKGKVEAKYFFGKPVAGGEVNIDVNTMDVGLTKLGTLHGTTDDSGMYSFDYALPSSFVGTPFEQGKAVVEFEGSVKDTADHKQAISVSVPVVKDPISIVVVPESPNLVPHIVNRVFIAAATPDGTPLKKAPIDVSGDRGDLSTRVTTDDLGLAVFPFIPGKASVTLKVTATDSEGRTSSISQQLDPIKGSEGILLRPDKSLAKVGERINLQALTTAQTGTIYFDVLREKQTILTAAQEIKNGRAELRLPITDDMVGTLQVHAYRILPDENIVRDSKTLIVSAAGDLNVRVSADRGEYRPGGDAILRFAVEDQGHHPLLAALGLAIVDESVFALSELQPGLEKVYFTLEKELMEPKYEIHGLTPQLLVANHPMPMERPAVWQDERQRAGAMLLAAVPEEGDFSLKANTYLDRWQKVRQLAVQQMVAAGQKIQAALQQYRASTGGLLQAADPLTKLVDKGLLKEADLLDPWGHSYKADLQGQQQYSFFTLSSSGPDGKWGTADDITGISPWGMIRFGRRRGMGGGFGGGGAGFGGMELGLEERAANGGVVTMEGAMPVPMAMPMGGAMAMAGDGPQAFNFAAPMAPGAARAPVSAVSAAAAPAAEPVRVRQYFPETMYWNPALITDENGKAEVRIPMADSITTWRLSMMANSPAGQLGSATAPVKVFQDFFVDIDLPVALTQNDRVDIPVAVYNYMSTPQDVALTLDAGDWFTAQGPTEQTIHVAPSQVTVVYYPIVVKSIGKFSFTVTARGTHLSDAVKRSVEVVPNGREVRTAVNDRLEGKANRTISMPADAVPGASSVYIKLYPGTFSQVMEGLDGMLRMPNGCFEQTSSTTYPNVLILDYLKKTKKVNPEVQMRAEQYINVGYQRLVTFECKNGGFSWFGNEPANQILTAYGLLEFGDMAKVHDVDPNLINRTQLWMASHEKRDGSWDESGQGIAEGIINRQTGALRTTAYICWALAESGYDGPQVQQGVAYVKAHLDEAKDPYTLAVILNLLSKVERESETTASVADKLIAAAKTTDKTAFWQSDSPTFTGARDAGADLETTGLAAYGLAKWGRNAGFTSKVLTYLVQSKDSFGTWSTTQGTVWSMKALLFAAQNSVGGGKGTVTVVANGKKLATFPITPENSDVMRQIGLGDSLKPGDNDISLQYEGEGSLLYQVAGRYYLPWTAEAAMPAGFGGHGVEPIALSVAYDKTTLAQDDTATVTVTIRNTTDQTVEMPLVDVGIPPGFTVVPDALETAVQDKTLSKYSVAARQVILYMEKLTPNQEVTFKYAVKARFPIKARTPQSKAYPYYNPEKAAVSAPQDIIVKGRD